MACFTMPTVMGGFASSHLVRAEGTIPMAGSFDLSGAGGAAAGAEGFHRAPANLLLTPSPESKAYIEGYKKVYGSYPSDWSTLAYDCVMTWAQAATRARSMEPADVVKTRDDGAFQSVGGARRVPHRQVRSSGRGA